MTKEERHELIVAELDAALSDPHYSPELWMARDRLARVKVVKSVQKPKGTSNTAPKRPRTSTKRTRVPDGYWDGKTCSHPGCKRPVKAKWLCSPHYKADSRRKNRGHFEAHLRKSYGLTVEQYRAMLHTQGNKCKLCRKELNPNGKRIHIDHCHRTGKVRGILCAKCNMLVGSDETRIAELMAAIVYIQDFYASLDTTEAA